METIVKTAFTKINNHELSLFEYYSMVLFDKFVVFPQSINQVSVFPNKGPSSICFSRYKLTFKFAAIQEKQDPISFFQIILKLAFVMLPQIVPTNCFVLCFTQIQIVNLCILLQQSILALVFVVKQVAEAVKVVVLPISSIAYLLLSIKQCTESIEIVIRVQLSFIKRSIFKLDLLQPSFLQPYSPLNFLRHTHNSLLSSFYDGSGFEAHIGFIFLVQSLNVVSQISQNLAFAFCFNFKCFCKWIRLSVGQSNT